MKCLEHSKCPIYGSHDYFYLGLSIRISLAMLILDFFFSLRRYLTLPRAYFLIIYLKLVIASLMISKEKLLRMIREGYLGFGENNPV